MSIENQLTEALAAYHKLMIGQHVTVVMEDGTRVEYAPADIKRLDAYIDRLKAQCGIKSSRRSGTRRMIF